MFVTSFEESLHQEKQDDKIERFLSISELQQMSFTATDMTHMRKASMLSQTEAVGPKKLSKDSKNKKVARTLKIDKIQHYNFGLNKVTIITTSLLLLMILYGVVRFAVLDDLTSESRYLVKMSVTALKMYVNTLVMNMALFETVMWNNTAKIGYKPSRDYFFEALGRHKGLLQDYNDLLAIDQGDATKMLKEKLNLVMCEVYKNTDDNFKDYVNCNMSLGGIATKPVLKFIPMYYVLCENLIRDWESTTTDEERFNLIKLDQYNSLFIYATYNLWGTADALYYNVMMPSITMLIQELDKFSPTLNLTNIISGIFFFLVIPITFRFITKTLFEILSQFWSLIYIIPLNLVDTNTRLKQKLKLAHSNKAFTSFS